MFKKFYSLTEVMAWIGYVALAAIVLTVFVDVCGRFLFNRPITGSYELVVLSMTIFGGFAILYTTVKREHIAVDLLVIRLPRRTQAILQVMGSLLTLVGWGALAYAIFRRALWSWSSLETLSLLFPIPVAPFLSTLAIAIVLCFLASLVQTFHQEVAEEKEKEFRE